MVADLRFRTMTIGLNDLNVGLLHDRMTNVRGGAAFRPMLGS